MDQVAKHLQELYTNADPQAKAQANSWLQAFQKETAAWSTAGAILGAADASVEPKLFAAQTFRTKIIYDLEDLSTQDKLALRDSLLSALQSHASSPRVLIRAIALALADLLLQLPEWSQPVKAVSELLGGDPLTATALLEFLTVLPEEAASNGRIDTTNNDVLTEETGALIVSLLSTYLQSQGVSASMHKQVMLCLAAWVRSGGIMPEAVANTPLFDAAFQALQGDELFDEAVEILTDLIHETQEIQDHVEVIQQIVPRLIPLQSSVAASQDDPDRIKGLTKILAEAGEWYAPLITQHPETFIPLVQALADCAKCDELDVVQLTFSFWYKLSKGLFKLADPSKSAPFLEIYGQLVNTIFTHLRYPDDLASLTAQEKDDFREFRHNIGDTLKDCCAVLGTNQCLQRALEVMTKEMAKGSDAAWQAIEAPLFAMRSMGARVDPRDDQVLPLIMDILPKLPSHPKIRYAAILVIGRYTEWTNEHPQHIPFQLDYLSNGFGDADTQVWLAAAASLRYLCQDCGRHMVVFLPQLHSFLNEISARLPPDDLQEITTGIAYIIQPMESAEGINALSLFAHPILEQVVRLSTSPQLEGGQLRILADALERLVSLLDICMRFREGLPESCHATAAEGWKMLDSVLQRQGNIRSVCDVTCNLLRVSLDFFDRLARPLAPSILQRLTQAWQLTNLSSYMWATAKLAQLVESPQSGDAIFDALAVAFDQQSQHLFQFFNSNSMRQNEDVVEDYFILLDSLMHRTPDLIVLSPHLPATLAFVSSSLASINPKIIRKSIDYLLELVGHEALGPNPPPTLPRQAEFAAAVRAAVQQNGFGCVSAMITGIVTDFEDTASCITAFRLLGERFPAELAQWVPAALQQLPEKALAASEQQSFLGDFQQAIAAGDLMKVRSSFMALDRMSRKAKRRQWDEERERRRLGMPELIPV